MKYWGFDEPAVQTRLEWLVKHSTKECNKYGLFTHQLGAHFNHAHALAQVYESIEPTFALTEIKRHIQTNADSMHEMIRTPNNRTIKEYFQGLKHIQQAIYITQPHELISPKYPEIYFALTTGKFAHQLEWGITPTTAMRGMLEHELHRMWINEYYDQFNNKPSVPKLRTRYSLVEEVIKPIIQQYPTAQIDIVGSTQEHQNIDKGFVRVDLIFDTLTKNIHMPSSEGVRIQRLENQYIIETAYDYSIGLYKVRGYLNGRAPKPGKSSI